MKQYCQIEIWMKLKKIPFQFTKMNNNSEQFLTNVKNLKNK